MKKQVRSSTRGSAVLTVLILAAVTSILASGFLFRAAQEAKLATRSFYQAGAFNLAEAGIEEGLHALNTGGYTTDNGWHPGNSTDYVKSITSGFNFTQATGTIYIRIETATLLAPTVIAAGVISIPNQSRILKQLRVRAMKRRLWGNGIVAKGTLTFSGNASVDSYDSSVGVFNAATNRSDQATIATASTALDPIIVGSNASIYGYVATAGGDPVVGSGGKIYGTTTPGGTNVDTSRIRHDFTTNLPDATAPTGTAISLGAMSSTISLPRVGDSPGSNGRYLYTASGVSLAGSNSVTVLGPVDLIVTGNVSVSGNGSITVGGVGATSPSINLYCPGTIAMHGNGMVNATNVPVNSAIWGTAPSPTTQAIDVGGNGSYIGTVYAPNANVTLSGNGGTSGAIISKTATLSGNGQFHYDTQLGGIPMDATYRVNAWCELTDAVGSGGAFPRDNRAPFASLFGS